MSTTRDVELIRLRVEIDVETNEVYKQVKKTEKDSKKAAEKAVNILWEREEYRQKVFLFDNLTTDFDRINIAEYVYSDFSPDVAKYISLDSFTDLHSSLELYDAILRKSREYFEKLEKGEVPSQDLDTEGSNLLNNNGDRIENAARNYYDLYPPFVKVGVKIPRHIKQLYAESRWCYVLQNYCAAVALCRAILEIVLKDKIGKERYSRIDHLTQFLENASRTKIIPKNAAWIANNVILPANAVLHKGKIVDKKRALRVVETTKGFLEMMYE